MTRDDIRALLAGKFPDPDGAGTLAVATRSVVILPTLKGAEADLVGRLGLGRRLAVVSDRTTHRLLGARVEAALAGLGPVDSVVLPAGPHPDEETVARVRAAAAGADALVAVGSGTINDLCKYAGALDAKPCAVFGTAPSMNGYTSITAAITVRGHKKSLAAQAPRGVFLELEVLAAAPARMIRAGLGDSLCRPTAQADWLLAHLLFDRPYRTAPFVLLQGDEEELFRGSAGLARGERGAMARLAHTLVMSGFGMAICGSSEPASQGEHLIGHYAEMFGDPSWPMSFHGEQIGVTTLTLARLQERMLNGPPPVLRAGADSESAFIARFGAELGRTCWAEFAKKRLDRARAEAANRRLAQGWGEMRRAIAAVTRPAAELEKVLAQAGALTTPEELHWPRAFFARAVEEARLIRNRYTFLDLAADSGMLEAYVREIAT